MINEPGTGRDSTGGLTNNLETPSQPESRGVRRRVNFQIISYWLDEILVTATEVETASGKLLTVVVRILIIIASFASAAALVFVLAKKLTGGIQ
jgi:hypothetical protein